MCQPPFFRDQLLDGRTRSISLDQAGLLIQPPERAELLLSSEFRCINGGLQHAYRLIVDPQRHGEGVPVLPSVRERKSSRVGETIRGSVHDLGDHSQCADGPGAHAGS